MSTRLHRMAVAFILLAAGCTDAMEPRITMPEQGGTATESGGLTVHCPGTMVRGETANCWATVAGGYAAGLTYWLSNATYVAEVGFNTGVVSAKNAGTARITANSGNASGYLDVTVVNPPSVSITGPSSVTTAGTHTWTANPAGGNGSYTYLWESLSGSTWTPRGSGQSMSMYFDHYATKIQQVRVTVGSYGIATATYNVSVNIPLPPPDVYISGPGSISVKGTYSFTANASYFETPAYTWYERDCTGSSCGAWIQWNNIGQTFTRTLQPVSCGSQSVTWQLWVVVAGRGDGLTAQTTHSVNRCSSGGQPIA